MTYIDPHAKCDLARFKAAIRQIRTLPIGRQQRVFRALTRQLQGFDGRRAPGHPDHMRWRLWISLKVDL